MSERRPWAFLVFFFFSTAALAKPVTLETLAPLLESGQFETAEKLVREKGPKNKIQAFLSYLRFYQGDYSEAKRLLKEALAQEQETGWESFEAFVDSVAAIAQDFQTFESEHFILRVKDRDLILAAQALETLETIRAKLGEAFSWYPATKILVEIHRTKEEFAVASTLGSETLERSGAIGICKFHRLMILTPEALALGYRWQDALSHEYAHFIINHLSGAQCPLWLHEGTAKFHETLWRQNPPLALTPGEQTKLAKAREEGRLISFARMSPSLVFLKDQEEVALAFAQVAHAVGFFKSKASVTDLLKAFQNSEQDKAFKKVLGRNMLEFEQDWLMHLSSAALEVAPGAIGEARYIQKGLDELEKFVGADLHGHIRLGDDFRRSRNFEAALFQYEKALEKEPDNPVVLNKYAKSLIGLDQLQEAESALQKSLEKNPNYVSTYVLLGDLFFNRGLYAKSVPLYQESLMINPFNPHVWHRLAIIHADLGQLKAAQSEIETAIILLPQEPSFQEMHQDIRRQLQRKK